MRITILFCAIITLLSTSCGNFKEKFGRTNTNRLTVTVSQDAPTTLAWASAAQQFIIYVIGDSGTNFTAAVPVTLAANSSSATVSINVPNGTYHGYGLAWNSNNLSGDVGCWKDTNSHAVTGGGTDSINITISATATSCGYNSGNGPFGPSSFATTANFSSLGIRACQGGTPGSGTSCSPGAVSSNYGNGSVRVVMNAYIKVSGQFFSPPADLPSGLDGACITLVSGATTSTPWIIPVGNNGTFDGFLATSLKFYTDSSCSSATNRTIFFPTGLFNGSVDGASTLGAGNSIAINLGS